MLLSIIVPVYNTEKYLEECILSCYSQDIPLNTYEILIINDGSTDSSYKIAKKLSTNHENIKLIDQPNGGLSAARNKGIENSSADYIIFLDSDDWLEKESLKNVISKLKSTNPDVLGICAADIIDNRKIRRQNHDIEDVVAGKSVLNDSFQVCAPFSVWKRSFLLNNNLWFYKGIYHEDEEFTPRAYYLAKRVSFINDIVYLVRQTPNSITRSVNPKRSYDLINIVCPRLLEFSRNVDASVASYFRTKVGLLICGAFRNIIKADMISQKRFLSMLDTYPEYKECLYMNNKLWIRIFSFFYILFPNYRLQMYKHIELMVESLIQLRNTLCKVAN